MKKWITNKEIAKVLRKYSVLTDEFVRLGDSGYSFKSNVVAGYVISISEEFDGEQKTGRIMVSHTKSNGKYKFFDVWVHNQKNVLEFESRNLGMPLPTDADIIKDLQEENEELRGKGIELQKRVRQLTGYQENQILNFDTSCELDTLREENESLKEKYNKLINDTKSHEVAEQNEYKKIKVETDREISRLQWQLCELEDEYRTLQEKYDKLINEIDEKQVKNPRGAGRKKIPQEKMCEMAERIDKLLDEDLSPEEVQKKLNISRATYFRYKKVLKNKK